MIETPKVVLGIDPGVTTGALALVDVANREVFKVWDMPNRPKTFGKGNETDPEALIEIIRSVKDFGFAFKCEAAALERVGAAPVRFARGRTGDNDEGKQGSVSMFGFGCGVGHLEMVLTVFGFKIYRPTPQAWKKAAGLWKAPKEASRGRAAELYPDAAVYLQRKKDINRADAILIPEGIKW